MSEPTAGHVCAQCGRFTDLSRQSDTVLTPSGRLCGRCAQRFRSDLDVVAAAWRWLDAHPGVATGSNAAGGADPQLPGGTGRLAFLAAGQGSPTGAVRDILAALHAWGNRTMHPYLFARPLPVLADALRVDIESGWDHPDIAAWCVRMAGHAAEATALCGWGEPGQWVTCPTDTASGVCGRRLRIDMAKPDAPVVCRWCDRVWTAVQLLNVAMHSGDGWADPASAAEAAGVTVDQIKIWARSGRVGQRHSLVNLADVRRAKTDTIAANSRRLAGVIGLRTLDPSTRCHTCGEWAEIETDTPGMVEQLLREWRQMHAARHAAEKRAREA